MLISARPQPTISYPDTVHGQPPRHADAWDAILGIGIVLGTACLLGHILCPARHARRAVSRADKDYVSFRDGWRCTYCGRRVSRRTRHIDHSVSHANGGTNHLNNLRLSCAPCNLSKGSLDARDFRRYC